MTRAEHEAKGLAEEAIVEGAADALPEAAPEIDPIEEESDGTSSRPAGIGSELLAEWRDLGAAFLAFAAAALLSHVSLVAALVAAVPGAWLWIRFARRTEETPAVADAPHLRAEVDRQLPVLAVLAAQLEEVSGEIEGQVRGICGSFQGMAVQARRVVGEVSDALGQGSDGTGDVHSSQLAESARTMVETLLARIVEGSRSSMRLVYKMEDVELGMSEALKTIADVERVARQTRLLALNASIEAARAGVQGKAFAAVATEVSKLSEQSTQTSQRVSNALRQLAADLASSYATLESIAAADMSAALGSHRTVDRAMAGLRESNEDLRRSAGAAAAGSEALAGEISGAVMALQFQDAISQRLAHVVHALREAETRLRDGAGAEPDTGRTEASDGLAAIAGQYTMDSERRVLARLAKTEAPAAEDGPSVELF